MSPNQKEKPMSDPTYAQLDPLPADDAYWLRARWIDVVRMTENREWAVAKFKSVREKYAGRTVIMQGFNGHVVREVVGP